MTWDMPIPECLMNQFQSIYSKKIEYAENKSAYFMVAHSWVTGECALIGPKWKSKDYYDEISEGNTEEQKETLKYYHENGRKRYIGDAVFREVDSFYKNDEEFEKLRKVHISQCLERVCIEEYESAIVFRFFKFHCHIPEPGETGGYQEFKRIYIENGVVWAEYFSDIGKRYYWEKKHYKTALSQILYLNRSNIVSKPEDIVVLLRKNFPDIYISENQYDWFKFFPTNQQNNQFQRKVNELNELVSKKIMDIPCEISNKKTKKSFNSNGNTCAMEQKYFYVEKLSENSFVVRMFLNDGEKAFEYGRFFVDEQDVYPCYYYNGKVSRCNNLDFEFWTSNNKIKLDVARTILDKRMPHIKRQKNNYILYNILMSRKYLIIEQLGKLGYTQFVNSCLQASYGKRMLRIMFNDNGLSFKKDTKKNGVSTFFSKSELKRLFLFKSYIKDYSDIINMKILFSGCGISDIGILRKIANTMNDYLLKNCMGQYVDILSAIAFRIEDSKKINILANKIWQQYVNIEKVCNKEYYIWHNLRDAYSMCSDAYIEDNEYYRQLCLISALRTAEDISAIHDKLMCLCKFKEYPIERFNKIRKKHEKWEFSDENFDVRLPNGTDEIIMEGSRMHHCVGTYVDRFMKGSTIIMFLRRKNEPDKEYVTIEMDKEGSLYQIKCKNNYMVSSKSTLDFLAKWVQEKRLDVKTQDVVWDKGIMKPSLRPYTDYFIEEDSVAKSIRNKLK